MIDPTAARTDPHSENNGYMTSAFYAQNVVKACTWALVTLLSMRGLFAFYGANVKSNFEQFIQFITDPFVVPFQNMAVNTKAAEVPVFIALVFFAVVGIAAWQFIGLLPRLHDYREKLSHQRTARIT